MLTVFIIAVAGYVAYVFLRFHRIEDNQILEVEETEREQAIPVGQELTVTSYNIGFGAYSDDYTFFMDGGEESRARSEEAVYENIGGAMNALLSVSPDIPLTIPAA